MPDPPNDSQVVATTDPSAPIAPSDPPADTAPPTDPAPPAEPDGALPPSPPPFVEPTVDTTPPTATLRDQLGEMGMGEFSHLESDEVALRHLTDNYQTMAENHEAFREFQEQREAFAAYRQQQEPQPTPPTAPTAATQQPPVATPGFEPWKPPTISQEDFQQVEVDESTGRYRHKMGSSPAAAERVNTYMAAVARENEQMWQKGPAAYMQPAIDARLDARFDEKFDARFAAIEQKQAERQFWSENGEWMVARDEQGKPVVNNANQQMMFTDRGEEFRTNLLALQEQYAERLSVEEMQHLALRMTPESAPAATPPATPVDKRDAANMSIQRAAAAKRSNRSGTISRAPTGSGSPSQNDGLPLRERMLKNLAEDTGPT